MGAWCLHVPPARNTHLSMSIQLLRRFAAHVMAGATLFLLAPALSWAQAQAGSSADANTATGPIRLRQPQLPQDRRAPPQQPPLDPDAQDFARDRDFLPGASEQPLLLPRVYRPGEFERYIQLRTNDRTIRRFGSDLIVDAASPAAAEVDAPAVVPPDYALAPGDELVLTTWGSVEADLRLVVDKDGITRYLGPTRNGDNQHQSWNLTQTTAGMLLSCPAGYLAFDETGQKRALTFVKTPGINTMWMFHTGSETFRPCHSGLKGFAIGQRDPDNREMVRGGSLFLSKTPIKFQLQNAAPN